MSKPGKSKWKSLVLGLGMGLVGAGFGFLLAKGAMGLGPANESLKSLSAWDLLALPLAWLLVIAVHEGGHLAGGMTRGMRFLLIIVGPFGLVRTGQGLAFRWYFNLGTLGGVAAALPVASAPIKPQLQRLVVGGPLSSLLLAGLCAAVFVVSEGRVAAYAAIIGALSALIFLVTAVPMRAGGFMSDGMQLLSLSRDPGMVERRARLIGLMGLSLAGTRPRDLDADALRQAQEMAGNEPLFDIGAWTYSYFHAWDTGDLAAAGHWMERIAEVFDQYPDGFRQAVAIELALHEAWQKNRLPEAQAWLAKTRGGVVDASRRSLAEAAVAMRQGDLARAGKALDAARASVGKAMDPGLARLSADQISQMRAELDTGPTAARAA